MSVADILQQMAQNAGRAQLARGAILGNTIADASLVPGQILNDRERQQFVDEQRARLRAEDARRTADQTRADADTQRKEQERQDRGAIMVAGLDPASPTKWNFEPAVVEAMKRGRPEIAKELIDAHNKTTEFDPAKGATNADNQIVRQPVVKPIAPTVASLDAEQQRILAKPEQDRTPEEVASMNAYIARRQPTAAPATLGSLADYLTRTAKEKGKAVGDLTTSEIAAATKQHTDATQKTPAAGGMGALYGEIDPKAIATQIRAGEHPPEIAQYGRPAAAAIASELAKTGPNGEPPFNLMRAQMDSKATQKHIATLNGAQQLRLNQAVNALPDMLDKVDALASQWKGGKFPILNKANLALAKGGTYGSDVASVANQLDAQIADVTADLGNVYMGGNSPTDHALGLAGKSLNGEWDEKVLHDMVKLAKANVTIRQNSIKNTGVAGASADNPYAPPAAAAPPASPGGLISVTDPRGGVHQFATQADADAFKKAAGIK